MKTNKTSLLFHPVFLLALAVLALNDFYWKPAFPNWFTGKLSDAAGTIVLPVFLLLFFPHKKRLVLFFTAAFFCWWKTPLSQPAIDFLQSRLSLPVGRTVDCTDLFVLLLLPLAGLLKPVAYPGKPIVQKGLSFTLAGVTLALLCSTTAPYRYLAYEGQRKNVVDVYENYGSRKTKEEILAGLQQKGIRFIKSDTRYYPHRDPEQLYYRIKTDNDSVSEWIPVPQGADSVVYLRRTSSTPFYIIPFCVLEGDTLRNIEFNIYSHDRNKTKSEIWVETFQTDQPEKYNDFSTGKLRKQYSKHFKQLFAP